jgi:hypothetical protein
MFEAMDVDISILSQFVFFARPPNYLSPAALQQQWATRAFVIGSALLILAQKRLR